MSKHNKVNRDAYTQRGRLTPDEAARERMKQVQAGSTRRMEGRPHSELKATTSGDADTDPADDDPAEQSDDAEETETEDEN
ncbi:MAG TPA: hypothetical protein VM096_03335 [Vicinamibacterales bacterium]|nr:hypothetical protein [Vicinamibacterales bacterium]